MAAAVSECYNEPKPVRVPHYGTRSRTIMGSSTTYLSPELMLRFRCFVHTESTFASPSPSINSNYTLPKTPISGACIGDYGQARATM